MTMVQYNPKIDLWRIVDGRTGKATRYPGTTKTIDLGGQRLALDAHRLLKAYLKKKRALNDSRAKD
jgi:hypothetical protein